MKAQYRSTVAKAAGAESILRSLSDRSPSSDSLNDDSPASLDKFQQLIDGLSEQIGLMDESWTIVAVNQSWTRAARQFNFAELVPGSNYLAFCKVRAAEGDGPAGEIADGIRRIDSGSAKSFSFVHQGEERWDGRAFRISIKAFPIDGRAFAMVTGDDITELLELRGLREDVSQSVELGRALERQHFARELHDSTMQSLVGLGLVLGQLKRLGAAAAKRKLVAEMERLLKEAQVDLRSISFLAHPPPLEDLGLRAAIKALLDGHSRRTGLKASLRFNAPEDLRPAAAAVLYRIVQEGLMNVHRHAHADRVAVTVVGRGNMVHAAIADNGIGLPKAMVKGVGLAGMKARLGELYGRLSLRSSPRGTTLIATVPAEARAPHQRDVSLRA